MIKRRGKRLYIFLVVILILIQLGFLFDKIWLVDENKNYSYFNSPATIVKKKCTSLCSIRATKRGLGQKIISISVFGPVENPKMFSLNQSLVLLQELINEMQETYSDNWILRVYHDEKILNQTIISDFEHRYSYIDFCNVTEMHLNYIPAKIWRFLPACDETVSIMASRDLDSPLTQRERSAMNEWIQSNLTFHSMRDHPQHAAPIMGGMWAFRAEYDRKFSDILRSKIFDRSFIVHYSLNKDQQFLADHLWPYALPKTMIHASYWCTLPHWNRYHRPFPTQRPIPNVTNNCFIGCPKPCCANWPFNKNNTCPVECRPKDHQDWIYC